MLLIFFSAIELHNNKDKKIVPTNSLFTPVSVTCTKNYNTQPFLEMTKPFKREKFIFMSYYSAPKEKAEKAQFERFKYLCLK